LGLNVQKAGGLPEYVCIVAKAIKKSGKTTSEAISIALSRIKVWASGVGVDAKTQAKAAAALAEWEKLRAKSHVKSAAKKLSVSDGDAYELMFNELAVVVDDLGISDEVLMLAASLEDCSESSLDRVLRKEDKQILALSTLTTKRRKELKDSDFALPGRRYPIQDEAHALNALARVAQHGTPAEKAAVRRAVKKRYPDIEISD
jgi:hypothetical protein